MGMDANDLEGKKKSPPNSLYQRGIYENVNMIQNIKTTEDSDLRLGATMKGKFPQNDVNGNKARIAPTTYSSAALAI